MAKNQPSTCFVPCFRTNQDMCELKSINNYFKSTHCGQITVYLDRIHQYLCAVNFCKDPCSIKEVMIMCPIAHVPNCPCAQLPMCPITHVPHHPRYIISIFNINHDTPLPMCPIAHMSKNMSSYQKDVKLSKRCQMSKGQTHGLWRRLTKKINSHNEIHTY